MRLCFCKGLRFTLCPSQKSLSLFQGKGRGNFMVWDW